MFEVCVPVAFSPPAFWDVCFVQHLWLCIHEWTGFECTCVASPCYAVFLQSFGGTNPPECLMAASTEREPPSYLPVRPAGLRRFLSLVATLPLLAATAACGRWRGWCHHRSCAPPPQFAHFFFGWRGSLSSRHQQRRCHPRRCYLCWRRCCRRPVSSPPTTPVHTPKSWRLEGPHIPRWSWHGARRGGCAAGGWGCGSVGTNTVKEVSLLVFSGEVRF